MNTSWQLVATIVNWYSFLDISLWWISNEYYIKWISVDNIATIVNWYSFIDISLWLIWNEYYIKWISVDNVLSTDIHFKIFLYD